MRPTCPILRLRSAPALLLIATAAGCDHGEFRHRVVEAEGTVTRAGEPVAGALVSFHPADPAMVSIPEGREGPPVASPTATTGDRGQFSMSTYLAGDGVPAGTYKVTVALLGEPATADGLPASGDETGIEAGPIAATRRPRPRLDPRYSRPETTPLDACVTPGRPNWFSFEVE